MDINSTKAKNMLINAVKAKDDKTVKFLLEMGVDVHHGADRAMRLARNFDVVKLLVEWGADIHADDEHALHQAVYRGDFKTTEFLLEAGANPHVRDEYPLIMACIQGHTNIVSLLLDYGADMNAIDVDNWERIPSNIANDLLERGINPHQLKLPRNELVDC